jgi:hypothetical protein
MDQHQGATGDSSGDAHDDPAGDGRRAFLRKAAVGAFVVPVISTFSMGGVQAAFAQTPTASDADPSSPTPTTPTTGATTTAPVSPDIDLEVSIPDRNNIVVYNPSSITHRLSNVGSNPSSGPITFIVARPIDTDPDGSTFEPASVPNDWTLDPDTSTAYTYTTTTVLAPGDEADFVMTYTTGGGDEVQFAASIPDGSGGDTVPGNNAATRTLGLIAI